MLDLGEPGQFARTVRGGAYLALTPFDPGGGRLVEFPQRDCVADCEAVLCVVGQHVFDLGRAAGRQVDLLAILRQLVDGEAE